MGVITATSKKHDKIKWSESIDTGLSLPTPAVLGHVLNDKKLLEQSFFMTDKMQPEPDKNTF